MKKEQYNIEVEIDSKFISYDGASRLVTDWLMAYHKNYKISVYVVHPSTNIEQLVYSNAY